jgi:hypothetical protein
VVAAIALETMGRIMRSRAPEKPRECPNCGTVVANTDRLCWHCYRSLPPPPRPKPEPVRRRRRRLPTSTIVAIGVIIALGGYFWHVRSSPTTTLMAYLRAEQDGDVKTAYRLLSVRSRQMIKPEDMANKAPSGTTPIYVVRDVEPQNGGAKITLDVTVEGGEGVAPSQQRAAMYMVREQGHWRVDMVRTCQAQAGNVVIGEHGWFRFWTTGPGRK